MAVFIDIAGNMAIFLFFSDTTLYLTNVKREMILHVTERYLGGYAARKNRNLYSISMKSVTKRINVVHDHVRPRFD